MNNKLFRKILNYVGLVILTGIVLYFTLRNNFTKIMHEILNINPIFLIICFISVFLYWFLRAIVLRNFVRKFKKDYSTFDAFRVHMDTIFFDQVTPFATGGQPYQIYKIKKEEDIPVSSSTNIVFQNYIVYQIGFLIISTFAFIYNAICRLYPVDPTIRILVIIGFSLNLLAAVFMFAIAFLEKFNNFVIRLGIKILSIFNLVKNKEEKEKEWREHTKNFHESASYLFKDKKNFINGILVNMLAITFYYIIPFFIFYGMGITDNINLIEMIVTTAYVSLMGSFIPLPGGTGGLEYGFLVFFGVFVVEPKLSAAMLIWRFITYYLGIIVGAIFLNIRKKEKNL